jgi:hypothetical protein
MINAETIPDTACFYKKEAGVEWYIERQEDRDVNAVHYMQFDGRILRGSWCGPRWVFWALVLMTPSERVSYCTHDAYMGAIRTVLAQWQRGERDAPPMQ